MGGDSHLLTTVLELEFCALDIPALAQLAVLQDRTSLSRAIFPLSEASSHSIWGIRLGFPRILDETRPKSEFPFGVNLQFFTGLWELCWDTIWPRILKKKILKPPCFTALFLTEGAKLLLGCWEIFLCLGFQTSPCLYWVYTIVFGCFSSTASVNQ